MPLYVVFMVGSHHFCIKFIDYVSRKVWQLVRQMWDRSHPLLLEHISVFRHNRKRHSKKVKFLRFGSPSLPLLLFPSLLFRDSTALPLLLRILVIFTFAIHPYKMWNIALYIVSHANKGVASLFSHLWFCLVLFVDLVPCAVSYTLCFVFLAL